MTFQNNIVRHADGGVNILGMDDLSGNQGQAGTLIFRNNLFDDIDANRWLGTGYLFEILNGVKGLTVEHNTGFQSASLIVADQAPSSGLVYQNNITPLFGYGIVGSGVTAGVVALDYYFPGWVFAGNVLPGYAQNGQPGYPLHPLNNFYPATIADVGFVNFAAGDYSLADNSPYLDAGSDGTNPGVDMDVLGQATAGVIQEEGVRFPQGRFPRK